MVSRVEQAPIFNSTTWLNWLVSVAVRADELVAIPINREYFWRMLRDWDAEHDRRGPQSPVTRGYVPYNAVAILPRRRLSLSHKVAVVAAIHDEICDKTKRIDPWGAHKRLRSAGLVRAKAGIAYAVLCSEVRNLTEDDRERVEKALSDIETELSKERVRAENSTAITEPPHGVADEAKPRKRTPNGTEQAVLDLLCRKGFTSLAAVQSLPKDKRPTAERLARPSIGRDCDGQFKTTLAHMVDLGWIDNGRNHGIGSGYFLTDVGLKLATRQSGPSQD